MKLRFLLPGLLAFALLAVGLYFAGGRSNDPTAPARSPVPSVGGKSAAPPSAKATQSASARPVASASPAVGVPPLAATIPARPGAVRAPTKSEQSVRGAPAPLALAPDFLDQIVDGTGKTASFSLPDGRRATGTVEMLRRDDRGVSLVQGRLSAPEAGFYFFQRPTQPGVAGPLFGFVRFDGRPLAYRAEPIGPNGSAALVARNLDQVICMGLPAVDPKAAVAAGAPMHAPQTHPPDIPVPGYQNGIVPLQSLPGATAVIYLDFDGENGPFAAWGNFNALPSGASNADIREVWQRVSEDFQSFNINVTTDRRVFDNANPTSRQHVVISPTNNAAPGAGGVAIYGSFNGGGDTVCWAFYTTGKGSAEVISHEVGHTLNLSHDGRNLVDGPEEYFGGHGDGDTGWAPIMGVGYYKNLTQWSKGEYALARNTEDDLAIITNNNNTVDYRTDDYGATLETAGYLEIQPNNSIANEGVLETRDDVDAFRFTTAGGVVSFTVTPVNAGPNVDIQADIYDSSNALVTSANPVEQINATLARNLPAGEYTLRVSGVGKGDPLGTGYTDYGVIGAYLISGSAANGVKPDRFTIPENSANGTAVGTVTKRKAHGENPLNHTIASGNLNGAFAIDPATGAITVANRTPLDFETLSKKWDDPARIPLFVNITDSVDSSLNETVRVVVTVSDVNERPTISGGSSTMFAHAKVGTEVFKVTAADGDRFDFPRFSIVTGNPNGAFAIDPDSGKITVAADIDVAAQTNYPLVVRATDQGAPALTTDATVAVTVLPAPAGYVTGSLLQACFDGINGSTVSDLTGNTRYPLNPDSLRYPASGDAGPRAVENYGSTVRGYVIPPTTGNYTFWIASDDASELRISPSAATATATVRASVAGYTDPYQYNRFGSQKSSEIALTAGQPYYIEVRHKQGVGGDHLTLAWQGPGIAQQIIPGRFLAPFYQNYSPKVPAQSFTVRRGAYSGATVGVVDVTDVNPEDTHGAFAITGDSGTALFGIEAATGRIFVKDGAALTAASANSYTLSVRTSDSGAPVRVATGTITVNLGAADAITVTGIVQQIWRNINGDAVSALTADPRYPNAPTTTRTLTDFNTGTDYAEYYGSRIRAHVVAPVTGSYKFYLASDDGGQLRFSRSTPAAATQIASVTGYVAPNTWTAQSTQASITFVLTAGQKYYLEVLHKQGFGGDFVQVAWTGPGITTPTIIPASALQPFDANAAPAWNGTPYAFSTPAGTANGTTIGTVKAVDPEGGAVTYAILSGNAGGAFAMDPTTGAITVANTSALSVGQTTLSVGAQDNDGGVYPQKAVLTNVTITVTTTFAQWRQLKFGADAPNDEVAGPNADPDADGVWNFLEYALGTEPRVREAAAYTVDIETIGSSRYLRLSAPRNPAAVEATLEIEATGTPNNAGSWSSALTTTEVDTATLLRARDKTTVESTTARFIRLSVSGP